MILAEQPFLISDLLGTSPGSALDFTVLSLSVAGPTNHFCFLVGWLRGPTNVAYDFLRQSLDPSSMERFAVTVATVDGITAKGVIGNTASFADDFCVRYSLSAPATIG